MLNSLMVLMEKEKSRKEREEKKLMKTKLFSGVSVNVRADGRDGKVLIHQRHCMTQTPPPHRLPMNTREGISLHNDFRVISYYSSNKLPR
jgi:hypothetical protein